MRKSTGNDKKRKKTKQIQHFCAWYSSHNPDIKCDAVSIIFINGKTDKLEIVLYAHNYPLDVIKSWNT